jgi:hypothetical protein
MYWHCATKLNKAFHIVCLHIKKNLVAGSITTNVISPYDHYNVVASIPSHGEVHSIQSE